MHLCSMQFLVALRRFAFWWRITAGTLRETRRIGFECVPSGFAYAYRRVRYANSPTVTVFET